MQNFAANLKLLDGVAALAREANCSMGQLALAWVLSRGEHVIPIPGTTSAAHLEENWKAKDLRLDAATLAKADALINARNVSGARYASEAEVDTEAFPA